MPVMPYKLHASSCISSFHCITLFWRPIFKMQGSLALLGSSFFGGISMRWFKFNYVGVSVNPGGIQ
jgi:hypothetical protein